MDWSVVAVLLNQFVGGAVDVYGGGHYFILILNLSVSFLLISKFLRPIEISKGRRVLIFFFNFELHF